MSVFCALGVPSGRLYCHGGVKAPDKIANLGRVHSESIAVSALSEKSKAMHSPMKARPISRGKEKKDDEPVSSYSRASEAGQKLVGLVDYLGTT